jgi:hypothetical protein
VLEFSFDTRDKGDNFAKGDINMRGESRRKSGGWRFSRQIDDG